MRYISIEAVEPGHTLARAIYASDGRTLLNAGVQLTLSMVNKLRNLGVTQLYIEDTRFSDIQMSDVISEETRRDALKNVAELVHVVQHGKDFAMKNIHTSVQNIISEILINKEVLVDLGDIRTQDNHHYIHALNVCLMSVVTGINLNLSHIQLYDLAVGALLHDIGKWIEVDEAAVGKDDYESGHSWRGFNYLRKKREISILSAHVALQHHECIDGSGRPRGVMGDDLHLFGKIVAVANTYDNLISQYSGNKSLLPYEACEILMSSAGKTLDHEIVRQFLRSVAIYPTGSTVKLTTGEIGIIVEQHKGLPARPVIRTFKNSIYEDDLPEVKEIDLAKKTTLFIDKMMF